MRLLHFIRLFDLVHEPALRVVIVNFGIPEVEFGVPLGPERVAGFVYELALGHGFGGVFHLYSVMEQPKLAAANLGIGDMGGGDLGHRAGIKRGELKALKFGTTTAFSSLVCLKLVFAVEGHD